MLATPDAMEPLVRRFAGAFTRPGFQRFAALCLGAIVTLGRRTVSRILWTLGPAAKGHSSSYHRVFSRTRWSLWPLGRVLASAVLELIPPDQAVLCAIDDTVTQHRGRMVYGKGCHRDAVRSERGKAAVSKWGHRWVILAVLVRLPFASRPWALPILCALYRVPKVDQQEARRHKTPCQLARGMLAILLHWFPQRRFIALGDGGFASHDLARFAHRHRDRLTLIARAQSKMRLHVLPPPQRPCRQTLWRRRRGARPRCRKGRRLCSPLQTVALARAAADKRPLPTALIQWYGPSRCLMEIFSACGGWYRGRGNGAALVPLRWVHTRDPKRTDRQDWFLCTDPLLKPTQIVEYFASRWSIEVTFEEARAHLGLETTRQRCRQSVLRTVPWLLGLFTFISLMFTQLWRRGRCAKKLHQTPCYHKSEPTFADALYAVRRRLWDRCLLKHVLGPRRITTLPPPLKQTLLTYLAEAA